MDRGKDGEWRVGLLGGKEEPLEETQQLRLTLIGNKIPSLRNEQSLPSHDDQLPHCPSTQAALLQGLSTFTLAAM